MKRNKHSHFLGGIYHICLFYNKIKLSNYSKLYVVIGYANTWTRATSHTGNMTWKKKSETPT